MSQASNASADVAKPRGDEHVQVAKGAGLTGIGAVLEGVLRYVSMLLVTRNYGREAYGVFAFIMTINEMGQRVSSAGLHDGVMKHVAVHQSKGEVEQTRGAILFAAKIIIGIGLLYAVGLTLFSDLVSNQLDKEQAQDVPKELVISVIKISCLALPTTALLLLMGRTLRALKQVGAQVMVRSFLQPISRVLLILVFLAILGPENLRGLAWAVVISAALSCAVAVFYVHRSVGLFGHKNPNAIDKKEFLGFALPLVGVDIVVFFSLSMDIFMLGKWGSQGDLGTYTAVIRLVPILGMPLYLFSSLLTPLSAELYGQGRLEDLRKLYQTSVRWIYAVVIPLVVTAFLWADPILGHLGEGFAEGSTAFMVLAATLVVIGFANPAGYAVTMAGHSRLTLLNAIINLVVVVCLGWWLIPQYGVLGAAIARAGSLLSNSILTLTQGYYILGLNPLHSALVKPTIAGLFGFGVGWCLLKFGILGMSLGHAVLGGMLIALAYALLLAKMGLDQQDKDVLLAGSRPLHGLFRKLGRLIGR
jgi:O-antigen/teichoic acid export membrane protein